LPRGFGNPQTVGAVPLSEFRSTAISSHLMTSLQSSGLRPTMPAEAGKAEPRPVDLRAWDLMSAARLAFRFYPLTVAG